MITKAKVSLMAVKQFEIAVAAVNDYSPSLDKGINCLDVLGQAISGSSDKISENIQDLKQSQEKLLSKIKEIETIISRLNNRIGELEDKLSNLEKKLSSMKETIILVDEEGQRYEVPNPEYVALQAQIGTVEAEMAKVKAEKMRHQARLDRAYSVKTRMEMHIEKLDSVMFSLAEKQSETRKLKEDLYEIKVVNAKNGLLASDDLKKIETIIAAYQRIKMIYENAIINDTASIFSKVLNINIAINKTITNDNGANPDNDATQPLSKKDISKHNIRFDKYGRICEYDNKTFGGSYNEYEVRLSRTSADDNLIFGKYEGIRGESKYIPSGRTAEGIKVIDILKQYGCNGIEYRNAEPDFEVCSEAVVDIARMTENRENYPDENGIPKLGNFMQADIECAKKWNSEKRENRTDWTGREVMLYRKKFGLTWHEKCDMRTMVMVRSEINLFFKHSGGCSECRVRDAEIRRCL